MHNPDPRKSSLRHRLSAIARTPEVTGWLIIGLGALSMTDSRFAELGYPWIDRQSFGACALCLSLLASFYRWHLQEHPARWSFFAIAASLPVIAIGAGFFMSGAWTGVGWMTMILLSSGIVSEAHTQLSVFYQALRERILLVAPTAESTTANSFRRIARVGTRNTN